MLAVEKAQQIILEHARTLPGVKEPLGPHLCSRVLTEDVASDLDMPPFDKALMDGYAVRCRDLEQGKADLTVIEEITAGQVPRKKLEPGQTSRIMTGAPIPDGADAVVMVERSRPLDERRVSLEDRPQPGQNILRRGREMREGEIVLRAGTMLRPQEIGILAGVGKVLVPVHRAPKVAILPTGDEIVEIHAKPGPGQIRNSNGLMLQAQVLRAGGVPLFLGIARDDPQNLGTLISQGLENDVLILSGGVSAGKLDLVPQVLAALGVEILIHKVAMKPGKPMLFGIGKGESRVGRESRVEGRERRGERGEGRGERGMRSDERRVESGERSDSSVLSTQYSVQSSQASFSNLQPAQLSTFHSPLPTLLPPLSTLDSRLSTPDSPLSTLHSPLVFGLPGNPVSSLVCFELFVRPALRRLAGHADVGPCWVEAELEEDYPYATDRPTYHPAQVRLQGNKISFRPVPWFGSPDLRGLTGSNAFVLLPAGDVLHRAGQVFPVMKVEEKD